MMFILEGISFIFCLSSDPSFYDAQTLTNEYLYSYMYAHKISLYFSVFVRTY